MFSPPASPGSSKNLVSRHLGEISGLLQDEGYSFSQASLDLELKNASYFIWDSRSFDLGALSDIDRVLDYLSGAEDKALDAAVERIGSFANMDSYDILIASVQGLGSAPRGYGSLMMALPLLKYYQRKGKKTVLAGNTFLEPLEKETISFLDYAVDGDFERPLRNILAHEVKGEPIDELNGIRVLKQRYIDEVSSFKASVQEAYRPYFDGRILELDKGTNLVDGPIIPYRIGKGVNGQSNHHPVKQNEVETKSIEKVTQELEQYKDYARNLFVKFDERDFLRDQEFVLRLAERLEDMNLAWSAVTYPRELEEDYYRSLSRSGCRSISYYADSFSDRVLKGMDAPYRSEAILNTIRTTRRFGIEPYCYLTVGHPSERQEDFRETRRVVRGNEHLSGASVRKFELFYPGLQSICDGLESRGMVVEAGVEDLSFERDCRIPYRVNGRSYDELERLKDLKQKTLSRSSDIHLFAGNYGRRHRRSFSRKMLRKLITRDYPDSSYLLAC